MTLAGIPRVHAQQPSVSLNPTEINVSAPGETFTVDVNITDITDMLGYEFKLGFNTTLLNATAVTPGPAQPTNPIYIPMSQVNGQEWTPLQNVSDGFVWAGAFSIMGPSYTGSGVLMTINFTALAEGTCTLYLYESPDTLFSDSEPKEIPVEIGLDVPVTVIPEFPATIVIPLLLIATLAATFLGKIVWSRKRKDALTAE